MRYIRICFTTYYLLLTLTDPRMVAKMGGYDPGVLLSGGRWFLTDVMLLRVLGGADARNNITTIRC